MWHLAQQQTNTSKQIESCQVNGGMGIGTIKLYLGISRIWWPVSLSFSFVLWGGRESEWERERDGCHCLLTIRNSSTFMHCLITWENAKEGSYCSLWEEVTCRALHLRMHKHITWRNDSKHQNYPHWGGNKRARLICNRWSTAFYHEIMKWRGGDNTL